MIEAVGKWQRQVSEIIVIIKYTVFIYHFPELKSNKVVQDERKKTI